MFKSVNEAKERCAALGITLPFADDYTALARPVTAGSVSFKNSIVYHPMEGNDAIISGNDAIISENDAAAADDSLPEGAPSERTAARYVRFAASGAALVWVEATAVAPDVRAITRQLWINEKTAPEFRKMTDAMRAAAPDVKIILQLTHSGRFTRKNGVSAPLIAYHNPVMNRRLDVLPSLPVVTDEYLASLPEKYAAAARLAREAGFDGVDVKACHRYLLSELLSAYTRPGIYGGEPYENRTRLLLECVAAVRRACPDILLACRLNLYDGFEYPWGFGVDKNGGTEPDMTETKRLAADLYDAGVRIISVTMGTPYVNPHVNRPYTGNAGDRPPEEPLIGVERMIRLAAELTAAVPEMITVGTGYSCLRRLAPDLAAGAIEAGGVRMAGFGRLTYAYPDCARDMLNGSFDAKRTCVTCCRCAYLLRAGRYAGCAVRDDFYKAEYADFQKTD